MKTNKQIIIIIIIIITKKIKFIHPMQYGYSTSLISRNESIPFVLGKTEGTSDWVKNGNADMRRKGGNKEMG